MKRVLPILVVSIFCWTTPFAAAAEQAPKAQDYETNRPTQEAQPIGYASEAASSSTISMSMLGWGLGLAVLIAIVAGIIHQSASTHSTSSTTSSTTSS